MKTKKFAAALLQLFFYTSVYFTQAQNTLVIPTGTAPVMDGAVNTAEWFDADSVTINFSASVSCKVLFKHDCTNLYLAYLDNLESMAMLFPEVLFDANNSKSVSWQPDDWWFHVSATDCYYQGAYGVYTNCLISHPTWSGIPNFVSGPPNTDTVEIRIPFTTINMSMPDTIGICFAVTNTASAWYLWPSTATTSSPAAWGTAVISCNDAGVNEKEINDSFLVYLSPSGNEIIVEPKNESDIHMVDIFDVTGKKVKSVFAGNSQRRSVDVSDLQTGMLLLKLTTTDKKEIVKKIQVIR